MWWVSQCISVAHDTILVAIRFKTDGHHIIIGLYRLMRGFHRTIATGVACWQGTLTPPDSWSRPIWDLHMFYLLRPILFPNLYFSRTIHFEHPLVLSQFGFYITSISIHLLLSMNVMFDFLCMGFAELWGMGIKRKIQNENICLTGNRTSDSSLSNPGWRSSPLGHTGS